MAEKLAVVAGDLLMRVSAANKPGLNYSEIAELGCYHDIGRNLVIIGGIDESKLNGPPHNIGRHILRGLDIGVVDRDGNECWATALDLGDDGEEDDPYEEYMRRQIKNYSDELSEWQVVTARNELPDHLQASLSATFRIKKP
ncbi:MAG TPA: hypothetical protein VGA08_02030 [Candidatus Saccharimonadales bacterium]